MVSRWRTLFKIETNVFAGGNDACLLGRGRVEIFVLTFVRLYLL